MISFAGHSDWPLTPLVVRSGYSLLRGTAMPQDLVARARQMGHTHLAMTDVNGLYGASVFHKAAKAAGVEPILGAELLAGGRSIVALVHTQAGYENLCRWITRIQCSDAACHLAKFEKKFEQARQMQGQDDAAAHGRDVHAAGPHGRTTTQAHTLIEDAAELSEGLHLIVADAATAMELIEAGIEQKSVWLGLDASQPPGQLLALRELSIARGLQMVLTGTTFLASKDDLETARLLAAIRTGRMLDTVEARELPSPKAHLRSPEQLLGELSSLGELGDFSLAGDNNRMLARECSGFQLLPRKPVFPAFPGPEGLSSQAYLRRLCMEGMRRRYLAPPPGAQARLDKELGLIERMGFCEYFLVVWDIVRYARRRGAPVAGRGSGGSSLVAYLLGITNVCPLTYDIPFERFLHENREDFPDLDVDFCWRIRDDVIDYAFKRWGRDCVAMVSTHITFQLASAIRETAKALGMSDAQITRMVDSGEFGQHAATAGPRRREKTPSRMRLARRLLGLPHNLSVHPGGIVIAPRGIDRHVPIQPAAKGVLVTQMDKDGVEDIRLVKLDLLGNRNLSTVRYACDLIRQRRGLTIDIESLPTNDADTVRLLQDARTIGCNQLESPAMRHLLRMMRPRDTRDVMQALALIRPGAASIGMKEVFIRRHRGLESPPGEHVGIDAILGQTHGVMLYEDDVMLVAAAMLGCPLPEADRFRKAVQKCHDDAQRLKLSEEFLRRCQAGGVDLDYAKGLWVQMAKFNAYSFCRAHAASYAILAYAGAYLKTHYPLEFWTSALNNNQSMYPTRVYVEQAKRAGIRFLLPDVRLSDAEFAIEPDSEGNEAGAIRVGLGRVAGLGPVSVRNILDARRRGPFVCLSDCLARSRLSRDEARALVLCGAFDWTGRSRPTLMMELNLFYALGSWRHSDDVMLLPTGPTIPNVPGDYSPQRKYLDQRRILGLSVGEHILSFYKSLAISRDCGTPLDFARGPERVEGRNADCGFSLTDADSRDLASRIGQTVRIAGLAEAQRTSPTQKGETMMFLTLEDEHGVFEVTLFPDVCRAFGGIVGRYGPYVVTGKVEQQYDAVTVTAQKLELVDIAPQEEDE